MNKIVFDEQENDWWTCTSYKVNDLIMPICFTLTSNEKPSDRHVIRAIDQLNDIDRLILEASALILDNYSYSHYKNLGISEVNLEKEETPIAISKRAELDSVWFNNSECNDFELSFSLPWDDDHSYTVEFKNGKPIYCSVNG